MKTYQKIKKTSFTCTNKMCENCPFCKSYNIRYGDNSKVFSEPIYYDIYIVCEDCGAKMQIAQQYGKDELIKRWNTRKPIEDIVYRINDAMALLWTNEEKMYNLGLEKALEIITNKKGGK